MQKIYKPTYTGLLIFMFGVYLGFSKTVSAATLNLPGNCSNVSSCISSMSSGDTLIIADGTYSDSIGGIKANTTIQAANDGKVKFTGSFNPGNAGFTMQGIIVKSSNEKSLGSGNTYRRMSFVGGPSCGNVINSLMGSNTKIYDSAFYGLGGRYLLLAYQQNGGIILQNVIFRPDGGWGNGSNCNEWEPHAAYNMYDTEGFTITGAILVDAIYSGSGESENIGGQVVNTHQSHGNVGTISQSAITTSGDYGRFSSDGLGSHNLTVLDSIAKGNTLNWGMTRNCSGTTTATRFDSDKLVEAWKGSINRTTGANFVLNTTFLNDPRWKQEMCADAGVTRGFCAGSDPIGTYVATKLGISTPTPDTTSPTSPTTLTATSTSQSSITVTWTAATDNIGVTGYIVERCQGSGCSNFAPVGTPTASPFVDSGLTANTFYNYHVRATDAAGNLSGWSNVVGATTQAPDTQPPTAPSNLQTSVVSSSSIDLTWTASTDPPQDGQASGVTNYKVERCSGASCTNFTQIGTPTSNSYADTGLSASTLYRYQVRAVDAANNNSAYSSIAQATTQTAPPVSANLIMAYNFNENTGTTATDLSGNNRNGTLTNGAAWATGKNSTGVNFDGSNDYINIGTQTLPANFTVSAWINNSSNQQYETIFTAGTNRVVGIYSGTLIFWNGSQQAFGTVPANAWHHIAVTYDGTDLRGYLNGTQLGSTIATSVPSVSGPTYLGAWYSGSGQGEYLSGTLDDVRIYNKTLTQTEIQADMNTPLTQGGSGTFSPCNTVTASNFSTAAYNSYGAPFDAFQTSTMLLNAQCTASDPHTIQLTSGVPGDTTRIVYTKGYYYAGSTWTQYAGTCTGAQNGDWCQGSVSATITDPNISTASASTPAYFVGMTCSVQGGSWRCGCRDTSCVNFYWMIQGAGQ